MKSLLRSLLILALLRIEALRVWVTNPKRILLLGAAKVLEVLDCIRDQPACVVLTVLTFCFLQYMWFILGNAFDFMYHQDHNLGIWVKQGLGVALWVTYIQWFITLWKMLRAWWSSMDLYKSNRELFKLAREYNELLNDDCPNDSGNNRADCRD